MPDEIPSNLVATSPEPISQGTDAASNPPTTTPTTPTNELFPAPSPAGQTGLAEKLRKATASLVKSGGKIFRKGKGRPRNCPDCGGSGCETCDFTGKAPGKADVPLESETLGETVPITQVQPLAGPSPSGPDSDAVSRFRRSVTSSIKGGFDIVEAVVAAYADAAELDPECTAKALERARPKPQHLDDFTDDLDAVFRKHNIAPKNAEEWALGINGCKMLAPYALLVIEFRREIRRKREKEIRS